MVGLDAHRGRVQAQGGGVEESVAWARKEPPTVDDGHSFLVDLHGLLTRSEQYLREEAFERAHAYVDQAGAAGGAWATNGPIKKSFPPVPRTGQRRVDIEVQKGGAFVP